MIRCTMFMDKAHFFFVFVYSYAVFHPIATYVVVQFRSIQFSSVPLPNWDAGSHAGRFGRNPLPVFSVWRSIASSSDSGRDAHSLTLSIQYFLFRPRCRPPPPQGALKDGFEEIVVGRHLPELCECPSLESCQKRFMRPQLILLRTQSLVLCPKRKMRKSVFRHLKKKDPTRLAAR